MSEKEILLRRLSNQLLTGREANAPEEVVQRLVAMQAQEYAMARWAIGLRMHPGLNDNVVEQAFNEGRILRTHVMRPTWHFVCPSDIRWLLALTAPRVHAINAYTYRQQALDNKILKKGADIIAKALQGGNFLTRTALQEILVRKKIEASGVRLAALFMYAELEQLICSGPRKGKQFTYALLDERAPKNSITNRDEALRQFAFRYLVSRGPATVADFSYWSGLTIRDARKAFDEIRHDFSEFMLSGVNYYYRDAELPHGTTPRTFLMPDYDEYGMSYKNRSILNKDKAEEADFPWNRLVIHDGRFAGTWERPAPRAKKINMKLAGKLNASQKTKIAKAEKEFLAWIGNSLIT